MKKILLEWDGFDPFRAPRAFGLNSFAHMSTSTITQPGPAQLSTSKGGAEARVVELRRGARPHKRRGQNQTKKNRGPEEEPERQKIQWRKTIETTTNTRPTIDQPNKATNHRRPTKD